MDQSEIRFGLAAFGLDDSEVDDLVRRHGLGVLELALAALRYGFTAAFVYEVLARLGLFALEFLVRLWTKKRERLAGLPDGAAVDERCLIDELITECHSEMLLRQSGENA